PDAVQVPFDAGVYRMPRAAVEVEQRPLFAGDVDVVRGRAPHGVERAIDGTGDGHGRPPLAVEVNDRRALADDVHVVARVRPDVPQGVRGAGVDHVPALAVVAQDRPVRTGGEDRVRAGPADRLQ